MDVDVDVQDWRLHRGIPSPGGAAQPVRAPEKRPEAARPTCTEQQNVRPTDPCFSRPGLSHVSQYGIQSSGNYRVTDQQKQWQRKWSEVRSWESSWKGFESCHSSSQLFLRYCVQNTG